MWGSFVSGGLLSLVLEGAALHQADPMHNLGILLDSGLLLVARRAFAQLLLKPTWHEARLAPLKSCHLLIV